MKNFILLVFIGLSVSLSAQKKGKNSKAEITWVSLEDAQTLAKKEPRKIMVDVYTSWCGPCKMMMKNTFTDKKVIEYVNEKYYAVKFNAEGPDPLSFAGKEFKNPNYRPGANGRNETHELTYAIAPVQGRVAYPTLVFIDEKLNILSPVQGYMPPKDIEPILKYFGDEHYKTVKPQEFMEKFKGEF